MPAVMLFVVFLVAIAISVPIGFAMVAGTLSPILITGSGGNITQLVTNAFSGANSTPILAVPLFIFSGIIMAEGGISKKLFSFFAYFVGHFHGGVPCAVIFDLLILRCDFRIRSGYGSRCRCYVCAISSQPRV